MSLAEVHAVRYKPDQVRLPKLVTAKCFRIRSVSKEKLETATHHKNSYKARDLFLSNDKYRSHSLKSMGSRKSLSKKSETGNSSDEENSEAGSCGLNSKFFGRQHQKMMERGHVENMEKLQRIAKIFDPRTIMKMGRKHSECSQEEGRKENRSGKAPKTHLRMNQYIFEGKGKRRHQDSSQVDEFWRQVNESLILPQCKGH